MRSWVARTWQRLLMWVLCCAYKMVPCCVFAVRLLLSVRQEISQAQKLGINLSALEQTEEKVRKTHTYTDTHTRQLPHTGRAMMAWRSRSAMQCSTVFVFVFVHIHNIHRTYIGERSAPHSALSPASASLPLPRTETCLAPRTQSHDGRVIV